MNVKVKSAVYILLFVFFAIPFNAFGIGFVTPALALFVGLMYALILGDVPYGKFNKKCSKYLLQAAVVGLGFGMNFEQSIQDGKAGMLLTLASVFVVMILAVFIGKKM
ncbi:MAG: putative sulfate exporter family transporter, partial [Muribaculaceae bacterium]